jgi:hypothetical protein
VSFRTRLVLAAAYLVAAVVLALEIPLALSIERRADSTSRQTSSGRPRFWPRAALTMWLR